MHFQTNKKDSQVFRSCNKMFWQFQYVGFFILFYTLTFLKEDPEKNLICGENTISNWKFQTYILFDGFQYRYKLMSDSSL